MSLAFRVDYFDSSDYPEPSIDKTKGQNEVRTRKVVSDKWPMYTDSPSSRQNFSLPLVKRLYIGNFCANDPDVMYQ